MQGWGGMAKKTKRGGGWTNGGAGVGVMGGRSALSRCKQVGRCKQVN